MEEDFSDSSATDCSGQCTRPNRKEPFNPSDQCYRLGKESLFGKLSTLITRLCGVVARVLDDSGEALHMVVAITELAARTGRMASDTAAALVGAGMLSVIAFPTLARALRTNSGAR